MRLIVLFLISYSFLQAQVSPLLQQKLEENAFVPALIVLRQQADLSLVQDHWTKEKKARKCYELLSEMANKTQQPLLNYLSAKNRNFTSYFIINAVWAEINKADVDYLVQSNWVSSIVYDSPTKIELPVDNTPLLLPRSPEITWGLKRVGVESVWNLGFEGQGVTVGGADTGIKWDVPSIKEKFRGFTNDTLIEFNYNWYDAIHDISPLSGSPDNPCGLNLSAPCDDHGHGTHTIGTMVGSSEQYLIGMAPKAKWIGCRNMERGNGAPSTYIECFQFFIAPTNVEGKNQRPDLAPHVINNSWYCSLQEGCDLSVFPVMEKVVQNVKKSGIVVVVSAGNDGSSCNTLSHPPAIFEASYTIGAFASNDTISNFSSNGPVIIDTSNRIKPNVVAPGTDVISQLPDGSYAGWSGTSMAGPHVAGLVALLISANPLLAGQVNIIEDIIEQTAENKFPDYECISGMSTAVPNYTYGYGIINAPAAISKALLVKTNPVNEETYFSVYPNPSSAWILIEIKNSQVQHTIEIFNAQGKRMEMLKMSDRYQMNIENLPAGMYLLRHRESGQSLKWYKG